MYLIFSEYSLCEFMKFNSHLNYMLDFTKGTMEGTLFAAGSFSNPLAVTTDDYINFLNITFGASFISDISNAYPISAFSSNMSPALYAIAAVITDAEYKCPTRRALQTSLSTKKGTYTYLWNHVPRCPWTSSITSSMLSFLGATHTSELAFVFAETSNLPQPNGTCQMSPAEQILSGEILAAWQSMATNGYPALMNGSQWPDWSQQGQGVRFDTTLTFAVINMSICDFWDTIQITTTSTTTTTTIKYTNPMGAAVSLDTVTVTLMTVTYFVLFLRI